MAKHPDVGDPAPDFELDGTEGRFKLSDHLGERVVLLFYPGDNTAVCTKQFCSYRDNPEAFGALDAMTRQGLQDELASLVRDAGATVIFVTHDLEEAIYLGDRIVTLEANPGRLADITDVPLARPRDQLLTREHPDFLRLRHGLYDFFRHH